MATIREKLDRQGFDWETGRIIIQTVEPDRYPGWAKPTGAYVAAADDPILDQEFDDGFGGPKCPRFVAEDATAIYFPYQYDGATGVCKVLKDIRQYLDYKSNPTPYPGG